MASIANKTQENPSNDWDQSDEDENWDDWGDGDEEKFVDLSADVQQQRQEAQTKNNSISPPPITSDNNSAVSNENNNASSSAAAAANATSSWGLWGGKLTSVLSTATEGLGNITNHVNQGLNQIIGVPDPEELARINAIESKTSNQSPVKDSTPPPTTTPERISPDDEENKASGGFGLGLVSTLGSKVINTGLDTLEGIGKKTMTMLQENDPKLMNKRKLLGLDANKPNLSEILLEAKKDADQMEQSLRELQIEKQKAQLRFEILFENYCGLVHFEALEILSKECRLKLDTLLDAVSGNALAELQETINEVKELLELEDLECESDGVYNAEELDERLLATIADAELGIKFDEVSNHWSQSIAWLTSEEAKNANLEETFIKSIHSLSEGCALAMCKLHKIAELLLVKQHHSTANEVDGVVNLCKQFTGHIQGLTQRYAAILNTKTGSEVEEKELCKAKVNTLFAEMLLAVQYIEKSYKLFTPILQMGAA